MYKVWLHLERLDERTDEYVEVELPYELGNYGLLEDAEKLFNGITVMAPSIEAILMGSE